MTELNAEILRRIVDNDASVAGVRVSQQSLTPRLREFGCSRIEELGEMIGTAIGNSRQLLRLEIGCFCSTRQLVCCCHCYEASLAIGPFSDWI